MTTIQMQYAKYLEDARHNLAMEKLTGEQNAEIARANRASEAIRWDSNSISARSIGESERHNRSTELVDRYRAVTERNAQIAKATNDMRNTLLQRQRNKQDYILGMERNQIQRFGTQADAYFKSLNAALEQAKQETNERKIQAEIEMAQKTLEEKQRQFDAQLEQDKYVYEWQKTFQFFEEVRKYGNDFANTVMKAISLDE